jgi:hypothetical protein
MSGYSTVKFNLRFVTPPAFKEVYFYGEVTKTYDLTAATHRVGENLFLVVADTPDELRNELSQMRGFEWDPSKVNKVTWASITSKFRCVYYNDTACYVIAGEDYQPNSILSYPGSGIAPVLTSTLIVPFINDDPYIVNGAICVMTECGDIEASAVLMDSSADVLDLFNAMKCRAITVSELPALAAEYGATKYFYHGYTHTIESLKDGLFEYVGLDSIYSTDNDDAEERLINSLKKKDNNEDK